MNTLSLDRHNRKTCHFCKSPMENPYFCLNCDTPIGFYIPVLRVNIPHAVGHLQYAQRHLRCVAGGVTDYAPERLATELYTFANYLQMIENLLPHEEPEEYLEEEYL